VAIGLPVFLWAALRLTQTALVNHTAQHHGTHQAARLLTDGPYGVMRHPMLGAMLLISAGICFSLCSYWGLVLAAVQALVMLASGLWEEKHELIPRFGDQYREYMNRVKVRYLAPDGWLLLSMMALVALAGVLF
jgi:protein-S-isoprenylcysteine O-methyltransferase Ste14